MKNSLTFLIFCIIINKSNSLEPIEQHNISKLSLARCLLAACLKYIPENAFVIMSLPVKTNWNNNDTSRPLNEEILMSLFEKNKWSFLIRKPDRQPPYRLFMKKTDVYIIFIREEQELISHMLKIHQYTSWNPHAIYLVLSYTQFPNRRKTAGNLMVVLKKFRVYNAVLFLVSVENEDTYEILTWNPYSPENCGDKLHIMRIIDRCTHGVFRRDIDWFKDKIPKDLNGCTVKVQTVVWPPYVMSPIQKVPNTTDQYIFNDGVEIQTMNTVAEVANLTLVYKMSDIKDNFGHISRNGNCSGVFCDLYKETVDVAFSALAATGERYFYFDATRSILTESLKFCVPHAQRAAHWENITSILKIEVLIVTTLMVAIMVPLIYLLAKPHKDESTTYKNIFSIWQNLIAMMYGMTVPHLPKRHIIRLLFITWIFYGLHLNTAYQTNLVSILTQPLYEEQIDSGDKLVKSNLKIYFLPNTERYFKHQLKEPLTTIVARGEPCHDIKKCLFDVAFRRRAAICAPMNYIYYSMNRYTAKNGESLLFCFKRSMASYPTEIYTRKGFPLLSRIETIIGRINSAGLPAMWLKNIFKTQMMTQGHEIASLGCDGHVMISISHMQAIFYFYILSMGFATAVFILELYIFKRKQRKRIAKAVMFRKRYNKT